MDDIIFISTTPSLTDMIHYVQKEMGLSYPVYESMMENALTIARKNIAEGTKVIVSRGGTAEFLKGNLPVPVVYIQHSFYDIHTAVQQAMRSSKKIGVIGYESLCSAAENYKLAMNYDFIRVARIVSHSEYESRACEMVADGIGAIIGGHRLSALAQRMHFTFIPGGGSERSVKNAIDEATVQLRIEKERRRQQENLNAVINSASEGIVGFKNDGQIIYINHVAKHLLNYRDEQHIQELIELPGLVQAEGEAGGDSFSGELIRCGHRMLALNTAPIFVENSRIGTVATLQEQDYIQMVDRKIRRELIGRGHVAKNRFGDIVSRSALMEQVKQKAMRYARSSSTVLIMGETGVGKEIFAQSIHNYSTRRNKPFVAINCAALPQNILESELFGYVKGAFTGARSEGKMGIFEMAHTGTVFLDEISELSLDVQAKLLRVIQEKELIRVGDDKTIPVDVRIIAACNADLLGCVNSKTFRKDLYYRIAVLELVLPPLRERPEDIPALVQQIISRKETQRLRQITPDAMALLMRFDWPGNVRQLINIIERLDILCGSSVADCAAVKSALLEVQPRVSGQAPLPAAEEPWPEKGNLLADSEAELIRLVLKITGGNRERAAAMLGISSTTLWRKLKAL